MQELLSKSVIEKMRLETARRSAVLIDADVNPHLGVVLVGADEMSVRYVEAKSKAARSMGIIVSVYQLDEGCEIKEIEQVIDYLSSDPDIDGVIIQLPIPGSIMPEQVQGLIDRIPASKDVDGLRLAWQTQAYRKPTIADISQNFDYALSPMVAAIVTLLDTYDISFAKRNVVVVGNGRLVGQPVAVYCNLLGIANTVVDEQTENILDICKSADLLICGTGVDDLVTYQWVKPGAVVLDCAHDVHRDSVDQVASAVSPAKGGLGPLTVQWLLRNVVIAAEKSIPSP